MQKRARSPSLEERGESNVHALNTLLRQFPYMAMHREALKGRSVVQLAALSDTMRRVERINGAGATEGAHS